MYILTAKNKQNFPSLDKDYYEKKFVQCKFEPTNQDLNKKPYFFNQRIRERVNKTLGTSTFFLPEKV